ncbi:MAG: hypothetical protein H6918_04665 [Sphingomonadaceae bacterium]|nr:hypothetical protein [Sphingomonadaceae bacterium]
MSTAAEPAVSVRSDLSGPPICRRASHDRLIIRRGRDVCGATLNAQGQRLAMGFLPTSCPRPDERYLVDAEGQKDRCLRTPSSKDRK